MTYTQSRDSYQAQHEIEWLRSLNREVFLKYVSVFDLRVNWGPIDKKKVRMYVNRRLRSGT